MEYVFGMIFPLESKANPDKFHILLSHRDESFSVNVVGYQIAKGKNYLV